MATKTPVRTTPQDLTITTHATQQDAALLVQILNGPHAERAADGMNILWGYDKPPTYDQLVKDHPRGSEGFAQVQAVLHINEMIATFVKQGLLDKGLVYDLLWIAGGWERAKNIALHEREEAGEPEIYANFERLAAGQT